MGKHLFWVYNLQLSFVYKTMSQISFNLFFLGDKRLLSEFLQKWGWFDELNERFPKHLGQKVKFQKLWFCRWKSNDYKCIDIFLSLENPCTVLLAKEKTLKCVFNTTSELLQIRTEKQIMSFKATVNWPFTGIWRYLVIGCFDWKIVLFLQIFVKIYYIPKFNKLFCYEKPKQKGTSTNCI